MSTREPPPDDTWPTREERVVEDEEYVTEPVGPPPDEPDSRIGKGLLVGILIVALAAAAIAAAYFLTRDKTVNVPAVVGLSEEEAVARLGDENLDANQVYRATDKPANVVVSQKPTAGSDVDEDSVVTLVVDRGAPQAEVPTVTGLQADEAVQKLADDGFEARQTEVSATQAPGTVVAQDPTAGSKLGKGGTVSLSVSKARPVPVPNVVGSSEDTASKTLRAAGFAVNVANVPSAQPERVVIAQSPPAGGTAVTGSTVRINVSDGSGGGGATATTGTTTTTPTATTTTATTTSATTTATTTTTP
jgi:beta-lactam-binding protein with PASTA domain